MSRIFRNCTLILLALFVVILMGCVGKSIRHYHLEDVGLAGEHRLLPLEKFMATRGLMGGNFFLGIEGTISSEYQLRFAWEPKQNEMIITTIPYDEFRFIIDDTKKTPTIEFTFSSKIDSNDSFNSFNKTGEHCNRDNCIKKGTLDYYFHNDIKNNTFNQNDAINNWLKIAKVRISRKMFESGKCFLNMPDQNAK